VILRILRGRAAQDEVERLVDAVRTDVDEWAASDVGPAWALPSFRPAGEEIEFLLASTWPSAESVLNRGGAVSQPRGRLAATGLLEEARAQHYELVLEVSAGTAAPCELLRLSSIELVPKRASAFYERVRQLWDDLVDDVGLVTLRVGRRVASNGEQAVVVSAWESMATLEAATSGGFVGGDGMATFYASEPTIEHFTALPLAPPGAGAASST
jgi:hypothetical protein